MIEPKDKRTKRWKEWKAKQVTFKEADGLGDKIEKVTKAIGIKKVVDTVAKKLDVDCGCGKRKDALNKFSKEFEALFTTRRKPVRCMTEEQYKDYSYFVKTRTLNLWENEHIHLLINIYAHVFATKYDSRTLCRSCSGSGKILFRITEELDKVYNGSKEYK